MLDWPATYSAYVFNGNEMWFLPRHSGKGKVDPVVIVLKGDSLKENIYFKDIEFIVRNTPKYKFDKSES